MDGWETILLNLCPNHWTLDYDKANNFKIYLSIMVNPQLGFICCKLQILWLGQFVVHGGMNMLND